MSVLEMIYQKYDIRFGVVQGSYLVPFLFSLHMLPLADIIRALYTVQHTVNRYAYDTLFLIK